MGFFDPLCLALLRFYVGLEGIGFIFLFFWLDFFVKN